MLIDRFAAPTLPLSHTPVRVVALGGVERTLWPLSEHVGDDPTFGERAALLGRLRLPHTLPPEDAGWAGEGDHVFGLAAAQPYLLLPARALREARPWGERAPTLDPQERLAVAVQALWALRHAHEQGLLLGDVQSGALWVSRGEGGVHAHLVGLGPTQTDALAAWPAAPERASGEATCASDLWALGRCLREGLPTPPGSDDLLATLAARLCDPDPGLRPARAADALQQIFDWAPEVGAALGGDLPAGKWIGRAGQLAQAASAARARLYPADVRPDPPQTPTPWAMVRGDPGSGRARLCAEVAARSRLEGARVFSAAEGCDAEAIVRAAPALVYLNDLEDADPDLRAAVLRLVRRAATDDAAVFVLFSAREGSLSDELARELAPSRALSEPLELSLPPLQREALAALCATLLRQPLPAPALDVVERWSGGNPGAARDALRRLREAEVLQPSGAAGEPWRVALERLHALPDALPGEVAAFPARTTRDQRRLLRALASAAAIGATPEALLQVSGLPSAAWGEASLRLLEAAVILEAAGRLRFARERARQRVLSALKAPELATLRREHVAWLERGLPAEPPGGEFAGVEDAVLLSLCDLSLALGDVKRAARFVPAAAARDRRAGNPLRAAERLQAWRPLLEKRPATERVAALKSLGALLLGAGRPLLADEAFAAALGTRSPRVDALERADLHRCRASAALARGDAASAGEALERARAAWKRAPGSPERAQQDLRLTGLEAQTALKAGERARVLELTQSARPRGADEDPSHEAVAATRGLSLRAWASLVNLRGLAHFHRGNPRAARACFEEGQRLCRSLELRAGEVMLLGNLALVADYEGDTARATKLHTASRELALREGFAASAGNAASNLGNLANRAGRLTEARRHYRESLRAASARGDDEALCLALCALGDTQLGAGDPRQALPYVQRAHSLALAVSVPYLQALAQVNRADALRRLGRLAEARAAIDDAIELRRGLDEPARLARALALGARVRLDLGALSEARQLLDEARQTLGEDPNPLARGEVELLAGELAAGTGTDELDAAERSFARAGAREGLARVALARAQRALSQGDARQALQGSARAAAEASACGSRALEARARTLHADAQVRAGATPDATLEALDALRAARSLAHRLGLPELARAAAAAHARVHEARGESLEAAPPRLAARRAVDEVCESLTPAERRVYRARLEVARDLAPAGAPPPPAPSPPRGAPLEPTPPADASARLFDCLGATLTLLRAERAFVLGPEEVLAARDAAGGTPAPDEAERGGETREGLLVVPIRGGAARLVVARAAPFAADEVEAAAGFSLALAAHVTKREPAPPAGRGERYGLIGRSARLREVVERLERFAGFALPVLVQGESGTGKELVARALHAASPRAEGPFLAVNASGFSEALVAAELFGAERGSYTGAVTERPGLFELAHGGTLFLDEIADAPLKVQAMLLRVLEERQVRRVGGQAAIEVDVRVVCASHRDLAAEVRTGAFREDLYYRLCGLELVLPPLRERREDIALLAQRFLAGAEREGRGSARLSRDALARLETYAWPGNVRELRNALERALALAGPDAPTLSAEDLGLPAEDPRAPRGSLGAVEREAIARALAEHETLTAAARSLGIDRRTLGRRIKRYGL